MADELLFDSERQEKKAKKRKWLLPAIVLAAILVIVVVLALVLRSKKEPVRKGGEDTLYPYTWQQQDDGSLLLEISHAKAPDYSWTLTDPDALLVVEASKETKEKNNMSRFTLKPRTAGRDIVELRLMKEQGSAPEDVIFKLSLLVEFTEEDGKLTGVVLNSTGVQSQGSDGGGADSANPYQIYSKKNHRVVVAVKIDYLENDWTCEILSGEDTVIVEAVYYTLDEVQLILKPGAAPGESELLFRSEAAEAELRLRCVRQEDGSLLITEHEAQLREKPAEASEEPEETIPEETIPAVVETFTGDETETEEP